MRKLVGLIVFLLLLSGCSINNSKWEGSGISFSYPDSLRVSVDEFDPFDDYKTIYVSKQTSTDFVSSCVAVELWRNEDMLEFQAEDKYKAILDKIRTAKYDGAVENFENYGCGSAGGNLSMKPITIDGVNGAVYIKALTQTGTNLSSFYSQVILVDNSDTVFSVTIPYGFGENEEFISSITDEFGEARPEVNAEEKWEEIASHLNYGNETTYPELIGFVKNKGIVEDLIDSIEITNE